MKPNSITQTDRGLGFDGAGQANNPAPRGGVQVNKFTGYMNDGRTVNKGRGPTVGNHGCEDSSRPGASASVTRDSYVCPPTSSVPKLPAQGSVRDNINRGGQVRGSGMTMVKKPSDPDSIRVGQSGGPNYGGVSKGKKPVASTGASNFNYGPKSQY